MITYIIIAVVLLVTVGYIKNLNKDTRDKQLKTLKDGSGISVVAGVKVTKELLSMSFQSGKWLANSVELHHKDAVDSAYNYVEDVVSKHGGVKKAGVNIGDSICDTIYLKEAITDLKAANKGLQEQLNKKH